MKRMYRVFDELHTDRTKAEEVLDGWEHKERITEVFAVGYDLTDDIYELQGIYLARSEQEALEELNEMM
jgi:hypothetical protein